MDATTPTQPVPASPAMTVAALLIWGLVAVCIWRFLHKVWLLARGGLSAAVAGPELTPPPELLPPWLDRANTVIVAGATVLMAWLTMSLGVAAAVSLAVQLSRDPTQPPPKLSSEELMHSYRGAATAGQLLAGSLAVLLMAWWVSEHSTAAVGWTRRGLPRAVLAGLDGLASVLPLMSVTLYVSTLLLPVQSHPILRELGEAPEPARQWALLLSAVLVAPVTEELLFRGLMQSAFRSVLASFLRPRPETTPSGKSASEAAPSVDEAFARPVVGEVPAAARWGAILATSALFALAHLAVPHSLPSLFILSVAMGLVFERTGSIAAPVTLHMAFNGVNVLMQQLQSPR